MGNSPYPKSVRLQKLAEHIKENPFVTDEELARLFKVSIQTIRLDRLELRIPEVRERTKLFAERSYSQVKSLAGVEIIGELLDIELEKSGLSLLEITRDMVFQKNNIARGHVLFAQANSLAVAIIDAEVALTGASKVSFIRPVRLGEKIVAKAFTNSKTGKRYNISVTSKSNNETVFTGEFRVFAMDHKEDDINENRG
jgi:acyl-coenzyme A thioesterase PaaI-like protein